MGGELDVPVVDKLSLPVEDLISKNREYLNYRYRSEALLEFSRSSVIHPILV